MHRNWLVGWGFGIVLLVTLLGACGGGSGGDDPLRPDEATSRLQIAALLEQFVLDFNAQDVEAIVGKASGFVEVGTSLPMRLPLVELPQGDERGHNYLRKFLTALFAAYPDLQISLTERDGSFNGDLAFFGYDIVLSSGGSSINFVDSLDFEFEDGAWKIAEISHDFDSHNEGEGESL